MASVSNQTLSLEMPLIVVICEIIVLTTLLAIPFLAGFTVISFEFIVNTVVRSYELMIRCVQDEEYCGWRVWSMINLLSCNGNT